MSAPTFLASFDIEDWFHAENVRVCLGTPDWDRLEGRVERNTHELLDILADAGATSTFFVLGWVARRYPGIVARIVDEGHELASHTDLHKRLSALPRHEIVEELARARGTLEHVAGTRVLGVRAPNFSISDEVLDCMVDTGYWYDSSFFAFPAHDRYGRLSAPIDADLPVVAVRDSLLELPMSRVRVGGVAVPWSGGAYFRLIPYRAFRLGVSRRLRECSWFMFYLHPWELDAEETPPADMPTTLRFRAYWGRRRTRRDLRRLLTEFGSQRIDHTLGSLGFARPSR